MVKEKTTIWLLLRLNANPEIPIAQAAINMFLFEVLKPLGFKFQLYHLQAVRPLIY